MIRGKKEKMADTNTNFEDAESFSYTDKDKLSFKDIVLQHLKKIGTFASVELRGGYWQDKQIPFGQGIITQKVYVPDTREVYSNAIEYFADILYPHFDKQMKEAEEKLKKEFEEAYNSKPIRDERVLKVLINRKLFRELCSFLYRKKYLELGTAED